MIRPSLRTAFSLCALALLAAGCGPLEIKIGKDQGVKPVRGSLTANLTRSEAQTFRCGDTITGKDDLQTYTVTSEPVGGGCRFVFDQDVEILSPRDYQEVREWTNELRYVRRVELTINHFDFYDETGARFEIETRLRDAELYVNGTKMLDIEAIGNLPRTVRLEGEGLALIKRAVRNREPAVIRVSATVTILDNQQPQEVRCEYEAQPTYVLSLTEK